MKYGRRRDANERAIIEALERVGCAVTQLEGTGVPDLAVEYHGVLRFLEVKEVKPGKTLVHRRNHDDPDHPELTPAQVAWWKRWVELGGRPPAIVHDIAEALAAIGAQVSIDS